MRSFKRFCKSIYYRIMILDDESGRSLARLTIVTIFLALGISAITFCHGCREVEKAKSRLATVEEVAIMRHHGANVLIETHSGETYFIRDGKIIKVRL